MEIILQSSESLRELMINSDIMIAGAIYNVENGKVNFLDDYNKKINEQHDKMEIYQR